MRLIVKTVYSGKEKAAAVLLLIADLMVFLTIWLKQEYDQIRVDEILFQLKSSSTGVHSELLGSAFVRIGVFSAAVMFLEVLLYKALSGEGILARRNIIRLARSGWLAFAGFVRNHILRLTAGILVVSILVFGITMDIYSFVKSAATKSDFIQAHYVEPGGAALHFPEQKRNLIYIFLESMENTYADPQAGAQITDCYIPELKSMAEEHVNFSNTDGLGGALAFPGTTWTAAAMTAQTSGIVVKVALGADTYGGGDSFLPGATSIGEILERQGYNQVLLLGSDAEFHGREQYFTEHGNYTIVDTDALKEEHRLAEDYEVWWGVEDAKLFAYAKEELTRLAEEGKPFNFTMLTADTHFPDGYRCELCGDAYESQYANVLACASRQTAEFVAWIQAQPFYENTTIVISGDHLTMDGAFMDDIDADYTRTVFNCIINPAVEPVREKNRQFGTFDMFPTTLAALGVRIEGDRLALGTNLFSERATLAEQYGYDALTEELQNHSDFYNDRLLQMEAD